MCCASSRGRRRRVLSSTHGNLTVGGGAALSSHQRSLVQIQPPQPRNQGLRDHGPGTLVGFVRVLSLLASEGCLRLSSEGARRSSGDSRRSMCPVVDGVRSFGGTTAPSCRLLAGWDRR